MSPWLSPEGLTAGIAVLGLGGVAKEYVRQRKKARLQVALELIEAFHTDELLSFSSMCLDWAAGQVPVPQSWRTIIGRAAITPTPSEVLVATTPRLNDATAQDPVKLLYRHAFVRLFDQFERMADLRDAQAIAIRDLTPIAWIAQALVYWKYGPPPKAGLFNRTMDAWYGNGKLVRFITEVASLRTDNEHSYEEGHLMEELDREYLLAMYAENAEQARQHETLRAATAGFIMALVAGLLAISLPDKSGAQGMLQITGLLICAVSGLGAVLNEKHYERNRMHVEVLAGMRAALEAALRDPALAEIRKSRRRDHKNKYKRLSRLRLHLLWSLVYAITFVVGIVLVLRGFGFLG